jgi:hypothetical protein
VVVVRHAGVEDRIVAGGQWPAGCTRSAPSPVAARRAVPHSSAAQGLSAGSAGSTLADQNDLFTSAMSAKRRGDGRTALAGFDRFLLDYPNSPLAESAVVERMRLLHATAPARCRAAASDYLAQHPNGFAHTEAEVILAETR